MNSEDTEEKSAGIEMVIENHNTNISIDIENNIQDIVINNREMTNSLDDHDTCDIDSDCDSEDSVEKLSKISKIVNCLSGYLPSMIYFNTVFTVIFGTSFIILVISFFTDMNPGMIPFKTVPIEFNDTSKLIRQLSILFTFISFITTNMFIMRVVLTLSFSIGFIAIVTDGSPYDLSYMMWNFTIMLINGKHVIMICYEKRRINFDEDREKIYNKIFRKVMIRSRYKKLMETSLVRTINPDRYYIKIGDSCNNLSILISGRMRKTDSKDKTSYVKKLAFIDSPEFILQRSSKGQRFNISFYAETDCKILIWPREMLNEVLKTDKDLKKMLLSVLGIDTAGKILLLDTL
jgi:hypothetical protein